jgi:hypothetical protein
MPFVNAISPLPSKPSFRFSSVAGTCKGALGLACLFSLLGVPAAFSATAETKTATVTSLTVSAADAPVTSVASGTVVTLTAKVTAGGKAVSPGQVNFCEAKAKYCTDVHLLATMQLTKAGTATYEFRPGIGSPSYKAVFLGTNRFAGSSSGSTSFSVTGKSGPFATATAISETGAWGKYTLASTVTEIGGTAPLTGALSFLDTSGGSSVLDSAPLSGSITGVGWLNPQNLEMNTFSQAVALADFNGDGIPDIALISGGTSSPVQIFLGNPDGSYTLAVSPSISAYTFGPIVVADFNGDGNQDMAILDGDNDTVAILLGNGDGTFNVAASTPTIGSNPNQIAVGDFNGDGIPDLAVTSDSSNGVVILLGNGDGTFREVTNRPAVGSDPLAIAIGDFNGDGKLDLAVTDTYDDTVSILLGKGDGSFSAGTSVHSGVSGSPIAAADFNRDGKLDLAVAVSGTNGAGDSVTILTGNGDGTFSSPASGPTVSASNISTLQFGDFNADGIPDLALTDSNTGTLTVFVGKGNGSFTAFSQSVPQEIYEKLLFAAGDLNGDGRTDLAISNGADDTTGVYLTEPTETASATASIALPAAGRHLVDGSYAGGIHYNPSVSGTLSLWGVPQATATTLKLTSGAAEVTSVAPGSVVTLTAEVTSGKNPVTTGQVSFCDAAAAFCTGVHLLGTASVTSDGTAIFKFAPAPGSHSYEAKFLENGEGKGSSSNAVSLEVGQAPPPRYSATTTIGSGGFPANYSLTATVEGFGGTAAPTGDVSFVDTSFSNKVLATAELGTATPGIGWHIEQTPSDGSADPVEEVTADFNGDGIPDLALLWTANPNFGPYAVTIFFGKGDGALTKGPTTQATGVQQSPSMIAGDFNGDGKEDLVILSMNNFDSGNYVTALLGDGNGRFAAPVTSVASQQPNEGGGVIAGSLVAADFNGDGKLDLAVVGDSVDDGGVTVLLGKGDGTFTAAGPSLEASQGFGQIASGDFNGDGIPDLVATTYFGSGSATVFLGKGDGSFTGGQQLGVDSFPSAIVIGDFNGDGRLDLAFGYNSGVTVMLGKGNGTFIAAPGGTIEGAGLSLVAGDFNGDGNLDLAGIDNYNDQIDLFEGAGNGTFKEIVTTPNIGQNVLGPRIIVAADFNKNGVPDLALLSNNQTTASILLTEPTETATASVTGIAPVGAGTHKIEASYGGDSHYGKSVSGTVQLTAGLEPPVITPASGTYSAEQKVTIAEAIPGATIYYQAFGTVNTTGFVQYTGPFFLPFGGFEQISAYATETGYQQSSYSTATYNLNLPVAPKPVFSPAAGRYTDKQTVTITDAAPNATIYYTTNGSYPSLVSTAYTGPISVPTSELISAFAIAPGYSASALVTAQYLIGSSQTRFIYTVAGTQSTGYSGDGGPATFASLEGPTTVARDASGNLFIADGLTVRRIAAGTGIITTVAGDGLEGYTGDGGPATKARLGYVEGLAFDKAGDLYIAEEGSCVVRRVAAGSGTITTVAGNGKCGYTGDNGPATKAELNVPAGLAFDKLGSLYIGTSGAIRKVAAGTGTITTFAGTGSAGYEGDGGPATKAELGFPLQMVFDASGDLFFADSSEDVVRKIAAGNSIITTVAGVGPQYNRPPSNGDGGPATSATLSYPQGLAIDSTGDLFISDTFDGAVREVTASNKIINTIAGGEGTCGFLGGDGGPALAADLCDPDGLTIDPAGNLYVTDQFYSTVREVTAFMAPPTATTAAPILSLAAGTYPTARTLTMTAAPGAEVYLTLNGSVPTTSDEGYYTPIAIDGPLTVNAIALEPGHLPSAVVTATYNVTAPAPATITTVAGSGVFGSPGTGGPALKSDFGYLYGVAADSTGNLYIADPNNGVVWKLTAATQTVSVVAGTLGTPGFYSGEGGPATKAILGEPEWVAVDAAGNLFISDFENERVFKVLAKTGIISTYAGGGEPRMYPTYGDGGLATEAFLQEPMGIAFDKSGNLYIADSGISRIRRVDAATGIITSVAGETDATSLGDGGPATAAMLNYPSDVALDGSGNLYIVDEDNARIRAVAAKTGIITTVAGRGIYGSGGDGGPATNAMIGPWGIAVDATGAVYFGNVDNTVRRFVPGGDISTIAGSGYFGFAGDGGPARMAELCGAAGLGLDKEGNLYIGDGCNYRVRKVSFSKAAAEPAF